MRSKITSYLKYILLATLIYFPLFGHLGSKPIRIWDEARTSINAYEMYKDGNYLAKHYYGNPELVETKPPLLTWLQVLFFKLIGINELALRLPSAIAGLFTCVILVFFSLKYLNNFWIGFLTVLVLISSQGYVHEHATRTGDHDALLTLFTTLYCLFFFLFIEFKNTKFLYPFFISLSLAVMTKNVAGLLFLPGLFIYSIIKHQLLYLLKNKHLYIGALIFLLIVTCFYLLLEKNNHGYIKAVFQEEALNRYVNNDINGHSGSFWFYYNNIIQERYASWYILVPFGILIGLFIKNNKINRITLFSLIMILSYFLIISNSKTKISSYDVPLYPFLAFLTGNFIYIILLQTKNIKFLEKDAFYKLFLVVSVLLIFGNPYLKIYDKTNRPKEESWDVDFYQISYYFRDALEGKHNVDNYSYVENGFRDQVAFYIDILKDKGVRIDFKDEDKLKSGDKIIVRQDNVKDYINKNYNLETIGCHYNIQFYLVKGIKKI